MPKTIIKLRHSLPYIFVTTALYMGLGLSAQSLLFAQQPTPKAAPTAPRLGEFNLRRFEQFQYVSNAKTGASTFSLTKADLISPRYDFSANKVTLTVKKGLAQTALATGSVHVTVRDQVYNAVSEKFVTNQTIDVDCAQAKYVAGKEPGQGRIDLSGNIRSKTQTPQFAEPLILTGQTGSIEFLDKNRTRLVINNGSAVVTPIEPTPAPPKKQ